MNRTATSSFPRPTPSPQTAKNVTLVDCNSLLEAGDSIAAAEQVDRAQIEYPKLLATLQAKRAENQWSKADVSIALVSANEESESQQRFTQMLVRSGFETDVSSYRDNYVSVQAGRRPSDFYDQDKRQRPLVSLSSRIAYALGVLALRSQDAHIVVVSHAFELHWPMLDFLQRSPRSRIALAYFPTLLDNRWRQAGLFDPESPIKFFPLDESELIGGVDSRRPGSSLSKSGLSRL